MQSEFDISLQQYNTLALPARARELIEVQSTAQLALALAEARDQGLGVVVLGEGSNVVLAADLDCLIAVQRSRGIEVLEDDGDQVILRVQAGENWHELVEWALQQGFHGLENLALIPGTVGAAPIQNIGAYGVELAAFVHAVHALRIADSAPLVLSAAQCQFAYRDSVFKYELKDQLVITAVDLRLRRSSPLQLSYPALAAELSDRVNLSHRDVFDAVVAIRKRRLPDPGDQPNVGSFFKNPVIEPVQAQELAARFEGLPMYPQEDARCKLPAAWLIDSCGWKGHREDHVGVHAEHALVLVNYDAGNGQAVLHLAQKIAGSVESKFGISLEIEPRVYGLHNE